MPSFFGVKDLRIDAGGQTAGTPRAIAWYGNAQIMIGTVIVENARGTNIYTEASSSAVLDPWSAQEEGHFDTVISRRAGAKGWHFRGPHNSQIRNYLCINGVNGDWAFHNDNVGGANGVLDFCDQFHAYTDQVTNRKGFLFEAGATIGALHCDGTSLQVASTGGNVTIHSLLAFHYGASGAPNLLVIDSDTVYIHHLLSVILATGGFTTLTWNGDNGYLGSAFCYDGVNAANTIALDITGRVGQFDNLFVWNFSGTGASGSAIRETTISFPGRSPRVRRAGTIPARRMCGPILRSRRMPGKPMWRVMPQARRTVSIFARQACELPARKSRPSPARSSI